MLVKYYKSNELKYTSRKRYRNISNFVPFNEEEQFSILLGDGANTNIKTDVSNICDYVTIDDTRWFVLFHTYLNGGQVVLYLQRDVFGENGVDNCFGKIERGHTDTFIKNRKELDLNQILKKRIPLIPSTNQYMNYTVDNHNNEMWGIMYIVKPTGIDPSTGNPYQDKFNINIPEFKVIEANLQFIKNDTQIIYEKNLSSNISFVIKVGSNSVPTGVRYYHTLITFKNDMSYDVSVFSIFGAIDYDISYREVSMNGGSTVSWSKEYDIPVAKSIAKKLASYIISYKPDMFTIPDVVVGSLPNYDYNNKTIAHNGKYYTYNTSDNNGEKVGTNADSASNIKSKIYDICSSQSGFADIEGLTLTDVEKGTRVIGCNSICRYRYMQYNCTEISASDAGFIEIDLTEQLVDEPFSILVFPLYDVTISKYNDINTKYVIERKKAFQIFNTVVQYLSGGDNPYLVDAQIYPYCPDLSVVSSEMQGYPFFSINSTYYNRTVEAQLLPSSDIKKEYIERQYSIISPEQSGKFTFNFYDYYNTIEDKNGINQKKSSFTIKTSLKPYSIIASVVINPDIDCLNGITYESDLRGCNPSSNGFECSLSSNAFQTYKRQNSNYQQIFNLQKEELYKQHQVERVNEKSSIVVNTLSAASMGAIAGASMGGNTILGKSIGGAAGAAAAGATVGFAMGEQYKHNEDLRIYEEYLQRQKFDFDIGTIKNLPNTINRISTFNEIIMRNFYFAIEVYECSDLEKSLVDTFIEKYGYGIGIFGLYSNFVKDKWFIKGTLVTSPFDTKLHNIASKELMGGIYIYE